MRNAWQEKTQYNKKLGIRKQLSTECKSRERCAEQTLLAKMLNIGSSLWWVEMVTQDRSSVIMSYILGNLISRISSRSGGG